MNFAFDSSDADLSEWIDTSEVSEGEDNVLPYLPEIRSAAELEAYIRADFEEESRHPAPSWDFPWESR